MASRRFDTQRSELLSRHYGRVIAVMPDGTVHPGRSMDEVLGPAYLHEPKGGFLVVNMWNAQDQ